MLIQERMSWTDKIRIEGRQEGRVEGRVEGREEGRLEGELGLLERLLVRKFGAIPLTIQQRIESATPAELEAWSLAILDATTLEGVFLPEARDI